MICCREIDAFLGVFVMVGDREIELARLIDHAKVRGKRLEHVFRPARRFRAWLRMKKSTCAFELVSGTGLRLLPFRRNLAQRALASATWPCQIRDTRSHFSSLCDCSQVGLGPHGRD